MIAAIKGLLHDKTTSKIIIETNNGVFYEIFLSDAHWQELPDLQSEILIYTSSIVREQELYLTGFHSLEEKNLFEILITAKGVGPKQALKILGEFSSTQLRIAITSGDISSLSKVKGISAKKAEQLILDLQEKMKKTMAEYPLPQEKFDPQNQKKTEILLTMRALGYSDAEIKKPLDLFFADIDQSFSLERLVSEFLTYLSKA